MSSKLTFTNNMFHLFVLAFYVGLSSTCLYDVYGLKHLSVGYTLFHISTGISAFVSLPVAG